jgi:TetR/AcrR family transcriptional regulator of autoinduction and epiphytic fitness
VLPGDASAAIDGRSARALRTRRAIVDALIELIAEGELKPPAPRIAERAGVSLRSIYQHFVDLEALFAAAQARYTELMADVVRVLPNEGTFEQRLDAFVEQRARVLEYITPARRAAVLQEPFSHQLQEGRNRTLKIGRAEVARMFKPELACLSDQEKADVLSVTDMVCTWAAWDTLRTDGRSVEDATRVMRLALVAILNRKGRR